MRLGLVACVVVGCASTPNLALRPDPSPPAGSTTDTFVARDGTQLLSRAWLPAADHRAVVVIMHGLKDYSARYAGLATRLAAAGYAVYAFDLRGHGRSAGPRVAPGDWLDYVDDLDRFLTAVEQREPGKPVFLFGHSMGGAIAALTAERHRPVLAGLVLSGPAIAIDAPPLLIAITRLAAVLNPGAPALKLDNRDFSSDPAAAAAMDKDDLVSQGPGPARTAAGLVGGMHAIWAGVDHLTMPLLAMHGTADRLTAPSGSRALVETAPATDKTLRIYDGYFHDLLHEPRGKEVEDDMLAWLDAHTGGAAVTATPPYTGHLAGDPRRWTQAVELGAGVSHVDPSTRFGAALEVDLARPRPLGWHGELGGRYLFGSWGATLRPLGIALRGGSSVIGVSAGVAYMTDWAASAGLWFEQGLGPVHLGVRGELDRSFSAGNTLQKWATGSLRLGGDRGYWPHARAGVGPALIGGTLCGGSCGWFALLGVELFGAD